MPPHVPFPVHRVRNSLGRMPSRIMVTKATVARQHVRNALLDRVVMAVPFHVAGADRHHRTPRCVPIGLAGWNIEAKCRRQGGDREHQSNDSFHRDSPDAWRTALLVEGIIGALRQINHSQKRAACGLLLARIRPEQTTVRASKPRTTIKLCIARDPRKSRSSLLISAHLETFHQSRHLEVFENRNDRSPNVFTLTCGNLAGMGQLRKR